MVSIYLLLNFTFLSSSNFKLTSHVSIISFQSFRSSSQSQLIVNPKPFLADLTGKNVRVRLKWGQEYQGKLASSDAYMNLQLEDTEEFIDGQFAGALGEVLIRCNNVLYIKAADAKEGAAPMET
eukprot:scaffold18555_cov146-Skeletonema_dohrnii-CCMP3373.AAC.6